MRRKHLKFQAPILAAIFALTITTGVKAQDSIVAPVRGIENAPYAEDNESCLKCHGEKNYLLVDAETGMKKNRRMSENLKVSRDKFYQGVHWGFGCTDCHSYEFNEFPHPIKARFEERLVCIDCHGYDETFAKYNFEKIDEEFASSTHHGIEGFTCWKCHDPHSYKVGIRDAENIRTAITYDNNMCLKCHSNFENFQLLSDREEINIVNQHSWLPNQVAHFQNVRCIECHTQINNDILVAHKVMPKKDAVRKCTECHSSDSRLMSTLYKFQAKEERKAGFLNAIVLNETYVIGATRNIFLNRLSYLIFAGILLVIGIHLFFRIFKK